MTAALLAGGLCSKKEPTVVTSLCESTRSGNACAMPAGRARDRQASTGYDRLFPELPPLRLGGEWLCGLGRAGGACDGSSADETPAAVEAGWPFFGQFVAHDITADRSAPRLQVDHAGIRNARTARLNLQGLYGDGPAEHPFLYRRDDPAKLLTAEGGCDVPRNHEGTAIVGDPRNDSHVILSQMHLAFARAHNGFVDRARAAGVPGRSVFDTAARDLRWHYQCVVLREFLPSLIGAELTGLITRGDRRYFRPAGAPYIPLEFAHAAYRYGHAQILPRYQLRAGGDAVPLIPDLLGFRAIGPDRRVEWHRLFDAAGAPPAARARKIDGRLTGALLTLPETLTGTCDVADLCSLAVRDLVRGEGAALPSGEAVARHMGERPLTADEIGATAANAAGTPLWYYILREAAVREAGDRLGPVGSRIVGEVLIGLLDLDPESVRHAPSSWKPDATLIELLTSPHEAFRSR